MVRIDFDVETARFAMGDGDSKQCYSKFCCWQRLIPNCSCEFCHYRRLIPDILIAGVGMGNG
jgi:hypothetical protein